LESMGIEKERIRIELSIDPEGKKIPKLVKEMSKELEKLGPSKRNIAAGKTSEREAIKSGGRK
jgi:coenzyme F420-reducing hydrogenase delta subunit